MIGELLGLDLGRVADQAALDLALRIRAAPARAVRPTEPVPVGALDEILRRPAVRQWAAEQLRPLAATGTAAETTLRTWLKCEAQLGPTAAALGISVPGVRKRLTRLEAVLQRSLLQTPSARYDLWLAFRTLDVAGGTGTA